jgi:hypothetical protein
MYDKSILTSRKESKLIMKRKKTKKMQEIFNASFESIAEIQHMSQVENVKKHLASDELFLLEQVILMS